MLLTSCGSEIDRDYITEAFEVALNDGENLEGKTVGISVDELEPDSAFGYNVQTGEHLNFISISNPGVEKEVVDLITNENTQVNPCVFSLVITV